MPNFLDVTSASVTLVYDTVSSPTTPDRERVEVDRSFYLRPLGGQIFGAAGCAGAGSAVSGPEALWGPPGIGGPRPSWLSLVAVWPRAVGGRPSKFNLQWSQAWSKPLMWAPGQSAAPASRLSDVAWARPLSTPAGMWWQTARILHRLINPHKIDSDTYMTSRESLHISHSPVHWPTTHRMSHVQTRGWESSGTTWRSSSLIESPTIQYTILFSTLPAFVA